MAKSLIHHREDWLIGYSNRALTDSAEQRYQALKQYSTPPTILLAERNPIEFLAGFIAACSANCSIFLGNPDWVDAEWQQVFDLVAPDLIWGDIPQTHRTVSGKVPIESPVPLIMIPTGGTSGKMRFAMHTWETLTASVQGFRQYFGVDRVNSFCVLPLYHVSGLMQFMRSFLSDGQLVILPWKTLETGEAQSINPQNFFLSLVPTQLQKLLSHRQTVSWLSQFETILLGGAPAWSDLLDEARLYGLLIAPTYGMTETASQIVTLKPKDFLAAKADSGQVLPHAQVTIVNETGEPLAIGETGRITLQSDSLMLGYYPNFLQQPVYQPDDLGFFDPQGYLQIVGRDSNKIITGGENVFPAEVEAAIMATKLVKDVCVLGISDRTWGQAITAVYVPQNTDVSEQTITASLEKTLCKFKRPKYWVSLENLPRNSQGKINRLQLKQIIAAKTDTPMILAKA